MARLIPDEVAEPDQGPWHPSERATLDKLAIALPSDYTVFHGIHWARIDQARPIYGEIDFIVMNRYGKLLAIEQKNIPVTVVRNDLVVQYRNEAEPKSVTSQVSRNISALRDEFKKRHPGHNIAPDHLLYLPESTLAGPLPVGVGIGRIVDSSNTEELIQIIEEILEKNPYPQGPTPGEPNDILNFLSQRFDSMPHIGLLGERARSFSSRLSSGLATWVKRLEISPFKLLVRGTAGSGKTQLALDELRGAHSAGQKSVYVCYNRALADAMKDVGPESSWITTFHELGRQIHEEKYGKVSLDERCDLSSFFKSFEDAAINYAKEYLRDFSCLVIDEAQDFEDVWIDALIKALNSETRLIVLEDPNQRLYKREFYDYSGWTILNSPVNFRSPKVIVDFINRFNLSPQPIEWGGAVLGEEPLEYEHDKASQFEAIDAAVSDLIKDGFHPDQIAVLSLRGTENSGLFEKSEELKFAGFDVKRRIGFTKDGRTKYSAGEILVETVNRFKGQAADAVVLVGDLQEELDGTSKSRIFVGLTRARLRVSFVQPIREI